MKIKYETPASPRPLPVDPAIDRRLYALLLAAVKVNAYVNQALYPQHVLKVYIVARTSDDERKVLGMVPDVDGDLNPRDFEG